MSESKDLFMAVKVDTSDGYKAENLYVVERENGAEEDVINHPSHYEKCGNEGYEPIDLIENYPFNPGTTCGYLFRAGKKAENSYEQDLKKSRWYLRRTLQTDLDEYGYVRPIRECERPFLALIVRSENVNPLLKDLFLDAGDKCGAYTPLIHSSSICRVIDKINEIVGDEQ